MEELRTLARELLSSDKVQVVIGYEEAPRGGGVRAAFITDPEETDRLVFDERCKNNPPRGRLAKRAKNAPFHQHQRAHISSFATRPIPAPVSIDRTYALAVSSQSRSSDWSPT